MPYVFFDGRAEEVAAFYQQALGADRFGVSWMVHVDPAA
jgi:uncharacterized glyoxalase superfamily protein PhnB